MFEVRSRCTSSVDYIDKPTIYEQIGVQEYFLYDPTVEYLEPPLHGDRSTDGDLHEFPTTEGRICCKRLGVDLYLNDLDLVIVDSATGSENFPGRTRRIGEST